MQTSQFHHLPCRRPIPDEPDATYVARLEHDFRSRTSRGNTQRLPAGMLDARAQNAPRRYWTTGVPWSPDVAIDADTATASHRMRAAQAWNAPVGHRFSLTHIVTIPRGKIILRNRFVVLPYFGRRVHPAAGLERQ